MVREADTKVHACAMSECPHDQGRNSQGECVICGCLERTDSIAEYWFQRFDEQDELIHELRLQLSEEHRRYRRLQELTGGAIARAHNMRGDAEESFEDLQARFERVARDAAWALSLFAEDF